MKTLMLECPFCQCVQEVFWDGTYKPRYRQCESCHMRFVYEPLAEGVSCLKPEEVPCSSDPAWRQTEMSASGEDCKGAQRGAPLAWNRGGLGAVKESFGRC